MTEKSEFREMRSFDLAIRRAYFKAKIRRNYAKNVVINRSENGSRSGTRRLGLKGRKLFKKCNGIVSLIEYVGATY